MRRTFLTLAFLLAATAAVAANPYFLDRSGVLWKASAAPEGLVLTGVRDGAVVMRSVVPFPLALYGTSDTQIQVAADELTGKVVVVWQRNWSQDASEIMLAVWRDGNWQRVERLTQDLSAHPRNPTIQLNEVGTTVPDANAPDDPGKGTVIRDSFVHVVWWEGTERGRGSYALLRLSADVDDPDALVTQNLETFASIGLACTVPVPPAVLEHPVFGDQAPRDRAFLLYGSQRICLFQLLEVQFALDTGATTDPKGITVIAQRRRHMPIFGVRKAFAMTDELSMEAVRVVLGADLNPVVYRVVGNTVEYVTATDTGWSRRRTLTVKDGMTMDQAIPLVERLAR
ncbi:MAG: hypothetical protein MUO25_07240 [Thermoanaerobaculaceae bacterium]|nr:hypothetical protein [Thermoanaerobaculaceae bacterium]